MTQSADVAGEGKLGTTSRLVLAIGAAWASFCTLYTGRHNASMALVALFVLWVLSPFAGFAAVIRSARSHHVGIVRALLANSIVVTATACVIYGAVALTPPTHHNAFAFLAVPAATWLAIGTFVAAARFARRP